MIDSSRDISNSNELIIAARFFDEEKNKISSIVVDILEQNQTKSKDLHKAIDSVLENNSIEYKTIVSLVTDNARDMSGNINGLSTLMKAHNKSLYSNMLLPQLELSDY